VFIIKLINLSVTGERIVPQQVSDRVPSDRAVSGQLKTLNTFKNCSEQDKI